jgi:hypothetical protein
MKKRYSADQIVAMLRQADVGLGKGLRVPEVGNATLPTTRRSCPGFSRRIR